MNSDNGHTGAQGVDGVTIERENPNVSAIILLEGTPVTKDISCTRVHVWVNTNDIIIEIPRIG
ncbi:hypothetical protein Ddye_022397 [Dipteronia dyeriana]|uniref:Protease inhibitor n=1 Tax=Dipteronia dyeriana TaxID=168575 RepID=A0AAD9U3X9_9ROSI|nr:hypothetical protein Ddye_022397 [Dipteronia dyeriana]